MIYSLGTSGNIVGETSSMLAMPPKGGCVFDSNENFKKTTTHFNRIDE